MTFECVHGARAEGMGNDLSFPAMFSAIAYVEHAGDTGDESLVVDAGSLLDKGCCRYSNVFSLFQEAVPMSIHRV